MTTETRRVRHKKRGSTYRVIGLGEVQISTPGNPSKLLIEGDKLVVYQCETDGKLWIRFPDEFEDGRFEDLPSATVAQLDEETIARDFDFRTEFEDAAFLLIGRGDGRGTEAVIGWHDLWLRLRDDAGLELDEMDGDWEWSDESPSRPYLLHLSFEAEGLTIVRVNDATRAILALLPAPAEPQSDLAGLARHHVTDLRQCSIFARDAGPSIEKAMLEAADFLSASVIPAAARIAELEKALAGVMDTAPSEAQLDAARAVLRQTQEPST